MVLLWSVRLDGVRTEHDYWLRDFLVERGRVEYQEIRKHAPKCWQANARCGLRWRLRRPVGSDQLLRGFDEADRSGTRSETLRSMSVRCHFAIEIAQCLDRRLRYVMQRPEVVCRGDE